MIKVHLDTDLGGDPDDLCALAMLLKWPEVEIIGITTVSDENGRRAGYTEYALKIAGREDIPVKAGADVFGDYYIGCKPRSKLRPRRRPDDLSAKTLVKVKVGVAQPRKTETSNFRGGRYYRQIPTYPKEKDFWPEPIRPAPNPIEEALDLLKNSIEQGAIVIGIGPFTNLALLNKKYSGILKEIRLFLMGGYIYPIRAGFPQWGNNMDYNIQFDTNSAKYVLENSSPTLIPLTVTVETAIQRAYLSRLRQSGKLGELLVQQAEAENNYSHNEEKFGKICNGLPEDILNFQHDPLACAVALGWDGVKIEKVPLKYSVEDSWLREIIDQDGRLTKVVTKVDGKRFNQFWLETVVKS